MLRISTHVWREKKLNRKQSDNYSSFCEHLFVPDWQWERITGESIRL